MKLIFRYFWLFVFLTFFVSFFSKSTYAIDGCFCGNGSSCYSDGCTRKPMKADGTIDYGLCGSAGCGGAYNCCYNTDSVDANRYFCTQQPPCCAEMVKRNDPEACCWPERGYCHPFYCSKVSRPEKCGWYWSFHGEMSGRPQGYGCTKGTSAADLQPVFGLPAGVPGGGGTQPTAPPQPTSIPTIRPTQYIPPTDMPTSIPTQYVPPPTTYIPPVVQPTNFNIIAPTQYVPPVNNPVYPTTAPNNTSISFPSFALPSLTFPTINTEPLKISARNTIVQSEKVLNIPSEAIGKITQLDNSLETMIKGWIEKLVGMIK